MQKCNNVQSDPRTLQLSNNQQGSTLSKKSQSMNNLELQQQSESKDSQSPIKLMSLKGRYAGWDPNKNKSSQKFQKVDSQMLKPLTSIQVIKQPSTTKKKQKIPKLKVKDFESKYNGLITRLRVEQVRLNEEKKKKPKATWWQKQQLLNDENRVQQIDQMLDPQMTIKSKESLQDLIKSARSNKIEPNTSPQARLDMHLLNNDTIDEYLGTKKDISQTTTEEQFDQYKLEDTKPDDIQMFPDKFRPELVEITPINAGPLGQDGFDIKTTEDLRQWCQETFAIKAEQVEETQKKEKIHQELKVQDQTQIRQSLENLNATQLAGSKSRTLKLIRHNVMQNRSQTQLDLQKAEFQQKLGQNAITYQQLALKSRNQGKNQLTFPTEIIPNSITSDLISNNNPFTLQTNDQQQCQGRLWRPDLESDFWDQTFAFLDAPDSFTPKCKQKALPLPLFIDKNTPPPVQTKTLLKNPSQNYFHKSQMSMADDKISDLASTQLPPRSPPKRALTSTLQMINRAKEKENPKLTKTFSSKTLLQHIKSAQDIGFKCNNAHIDLLRLEPELQHNKILPPIPLTSKQVKQKNKVDKIKKEHIYNFIERENELKRRQSQWVRQSGGRELTQVEQAQQQYSAVVQDLERHGKLMVAKSKSVQDFIDYSKKTLKGINIRHKNEKSNSKDQ